MQAFAYYAAAPLQWAHPKIRRNTVAITINESTVVAENIAGKVKRQRLLTAKHTQDGKVLLDRLTVEAGGAHALNIGAGDLAWVQILEGAATLTHVSGVTHGSARDSLTQAHIVFLPPGFAGTLATHKWRDATLRHGARCGAF